MSYLWSVSFVNLAVGDSRSHMDRKLTAAIQHVRAQGGYRRLEKWFIPSIHSGKSHDNVAITNHPCVYDRYDTKIRPL